MDLLRRVALLIVRWAKCAVSLLGIAYWLPVIIATMPFGDTIVRPWFAALQSLGRLVGKYVFGIDRPILRRPTGSGDTLADWVETAALVGLCIAVGLLWVTLTRSAARVVWRSRLSGGSRVITRYGVGGTLILYGVLKLFVLQMPLARGVLTQTIGAKSPMGMLWAFMAISPGYQRLTGAAELLAGLLLFSRRTTVLASMLGTILLAQVFALNMFFDVPVKLFSFALLGSCCVLLVPELPRLVAFFVANEVALPSPRAPTRALGLGGVRRSARLAGLVAGAVMIYRPVDLSMDMRSAYRGSLTTTSEKAATLLFQRGFHWIQEEPFNR